MASDCDSATSRKITAGRRRPSAARASFAVWKVSDSMPRVASVIAMTRQMLSLSSTTKAKRSNGAPGAGLASEACSADAGTPLRSDDSAPTGVAAPAGDHSQSRDVADMFAATVVRATSDRVIGSNALYADWFNDGLRFRRWRAAVHNA